jgi:hypothetical protein
MSDIGGDPEVTLPATVARTRYFRAESRNHSRIPLTRILWLLTLSSMNTGAVRLRNSA